MDAFANQKTQIVLNYDFLCDGRYQVKEMRDLIMYEKVSWGDKKLVSAGEKINLFRKSLLKIFKNIKNIQIFTTDDIGFYPCD